MNAKTKTIFYYGMIALLGIIFIIAGAILQSDNAISHRMIWSGFGLLAVGIIFMTVALKVQKIETSDKGLQRFHNAQFDERNQFIVGKSSSITIDATQGFSILACCVFSFFGMNNYAYIIAGYIVISSILRLGVSIYLRHKF